MELDTTDALAMLFTDAVDGEMVFHDIEEDQPGPRRVTARVASLGVKNANGRTLKPGILGGKDARARVVVSAWNHSSMPGFLTSGEAPVGYGIISQSDDERYLMADLEMLDDDPQADRTYALLKGHRGMQWSVGYKVTKMDSEGLIERATLVEASPVILGASPNTRTTKVDGLGPANMLTLRVGEPATFNMPGVYTVNVGEAGAVHISGGDGGGAGGAEPLGGGGGGHGDTGSEGLRPGDTPEPVDVPVSLMAPVMQDAAPEEPGKDALWVDTSEAINVLKHWDGSDWVTIGPVSDAEEVVTTDVGDREALRHILGKYGG